MAVKREKVVQTAEKYVQRGKIDAAIREYRKVLVEQPDDATTLNRVGDLYARSERIDEAIKLFTQIAQNYTADGFFPKATAIYKKIIKLDPTRLGVYEQLAGLYHRQGLLNEARTQYQVLADYYLKHDNLTSATAIYERMTEVDPDDPSLRVRLAELYQRQKLMDKAMAQYRRIAEMMLHHGHPDEAEQVLLKGLDVDPSDLGFVTDGVLKLREADHVAAAVRFLAAAIERNPQAARVADMVDMPTASGAAAAEAAEADEADADEADTAPGVETGEAPEADADLVLELDEEAAFGGAEMAAAEVEDRPVEEAAEEETAPSAKTRDVGGFTDSDDTSRRGFPGDDLTGSGEITLDLDAVFELDLEDEESPDTQVQPPPDVLAADAATVEAAPADGTAEAPAASAAPPRRPAPSAAPPADGAIDADFLERTAAELHPERIQQEEDLVTEAEVLAKYGLTEKAMERLGELLALNQGHPGGLGLLVRLHLDEGRYEGAAELATRLSQEAPRSEAWNEAWEKLDRSGFSRTDNGVVLPPGVEPEEADTTPGLEVVSDEVVSDEVVSDDGPRRPRDHGDDAGRGSRPGAVRRAGRGGRGRGSRADPHRPAGSRPAGSRSAGERPRRRRPKRRWPKHRWPKRRRRRPRSRSSPASRRGAVPRRAVPSRAAPGPRHRRPPRRMRRSGHGRRGAASGTSRACWPRWSPTSCPAAARRRRRSRPPLRRTSARPERARLRPPRRGARPPPPRHPAAAGPPPRRSPPRPAVRRAAVRRAADPPRRAPPPAEPSPEWIEQTITGETPEAAGGMFSDEEDFFDLAAELEEELSREDGLDESDDLLLGHPREQSLEEIVEGFKKGVSENLSEEDHTTHFDLGIAYREMGLLDEAIGEFQVAAKSPVLLVECCSMLGLCFLQKGLPELAVKWYLRGLASPDLSEDEPARPALRPRQCPHGRRRARRGPPHLPRHLRHQLELPRRRRQGRGDPAALTPSAAVRDLRSPARRPRRARRARGRFRAALRASPAGGRRGASARGARRGRGRTG